MNRKQALGWMGILLTVTGIGIMGVPGVWALLTASFSDSVWQTPTMKSDTYYVGAGTVIANSTGLYGAEIYRNGQTLATYVASLGVGATITQASPYTYIVWVDAGTYYANSTVGGTNYSGAAFHTVLQNALDAEDSDALVHIKAGSYTMTSGVTSDDHHVVIEGEGMGTHITCSAGINAFTFGTGTDPYYGNGIMNMYITGTTPAVASRGVNLLSQNIFTMRDMQFSVWNSAIYIDSTDTAAKYSTFDNIYITGCVNGIYQTTLVDGNGFNGNTVRGVYMTSGSGAASTGITLYSGNGNVFEEIAIEGVITSLIMSSIYAQQNTFVGLRFEGVPADVTTGIDFVGGGAETGGQRNRFFGGELHNIDTPIANDDPDQDNAFYGVYGIIDYNSGTGTISSGTTSEAVATAVYTTPEAQHIHITFTENPTNTVGTWWITGISSTGFTLNVENDPGASNLDFSWEIRITPDAG